MLTLERQGWEALSSGRGGAFYREHLAEEARMLLPVGVLGREDSITAMEGAPPWSSFTISSAYTVPVGEGGAALMYHAEAHRAGEPPYSALMTSVYVRQDGDWKLLLHQQTPLIA